MCIHHRVSYIQSCPSYHRGPTLSSDPKGQNKKERNSKYDYLGYQKIYTYIHKSILTTIIPGAFRSD